MRLNMLSSLPLPPRTTCGIWGIHGLQLARALGVRNIVIRGDSQLIVHQINGLNEAKDSVMAKYLGQTQSLLQDFKFEVPRHENAQADYLAKCASGFIQGIANDVFFEIRQAPSIEQTDVLEGHKPNMDGRIHKLEKRWIHPRQKIAVKAKRFLMQDGSQYKRAYSRPLLKCLSQEDGIFLLREIHQAFFGSHEGAHTLACIARRQGAERWATMEKDAISVVKRCNQCQRRSTIPRRPSTPLQNIK